MYTTDKRGLDLFVEVVADNDLHPETWNQSTWLQLAARGPTIEAAQEEFSALRTAGPQDDLITLEELRAAVPHCGTVGCIAGKAVLLSRGATVHWRRQQTGLGYSYRDVTVDGHVYPVLSEAAMELFGLEVSGRFDTYGRDLFDGGNTRRDVVEIAAGIWGLERDELETRISRRREELKAVPA